MLQDISLKVHMEMLLLTALSLFLLGLALFTRVPARRRHSEPISPAPPADPPPPPAPPPPVAARVPVRIETLADLAADFAWKNNQTVFVIVNHARTLAVTVGPPGGRA
jgi:hypothetical protein